MGGRTGLVWILVVALLLIVFGLWFSLNSCGNKCHVVSGYAFDECIKAGGTDCHKVEQQKMTECMFSTNCQ